LVPLLFIAAILAVAHLARKALTKRKGKTDMKNVKSIVIVLILVVAVGVVFALKQRQTKPDTATDTGGNASVQTATAEKALPRMVDLGADKCIPCKMMAPILAEMKKTYAGQLQVDFIDVWKNSGAGQQYGIRAIPTQIFFGPDGKELARHEGFISREDILGQWAKLGITFNDQGAK
jgi:thioredoxin 1